MPRALSSLLIISDFSMEMVPTRMGWRRLVTLGDDIQDGGIFAFLSLVDGIGEIDTGERLIGGQLHHIQPVDIPELLLLGHGGTGHAGQLIVHAEVVLEGDGGQGAVLARDGDALFGLDGLVQALGVAAADHEAAGELIDDDDLAVLHDIVDIPLHDAAGLDGLIDVVGQGEVFGVIEVLDAEILLGLAGTLGG